jgi:hypothetical protein
VSAAAWPASSLDRSVLIVPRVGARHACGRTQVCGVGRVWDALGSTMIANDARSVSLDYLWPDPPSASRETEPGSNTHYSGNRFSGDGPSDTPTVQRCVQ